MLASEVILASAQPERSALEVIRRAVKKAGITIEDIEYCVGTGYGRKHIPFMNSMESEIICHGRVLFGRCRRRARWLISAAGRKGHQGRRKGNVERYVYNDKCARARDDSSRLWPIPLISIG